ncbi:MAG: O-antigen ligase family protein [Planctomyces sp.]|nr:O-antigen ligase family protein [Planctomyces sp.]
MSGEHARRFSASGRSKTQSFDERPRPRYHFETIGLLVTDVILCFLLLIFPFIMGGREALGHQILISLAFALGAAWCFHKVQTGGNFALLSLEPLVIAGLMLVMFQTMPLNAGLLDKLSSEYSRLLNGWSASQITGSTSSSQTSVWNTASLTPIESKHGVWMLAAYAIIGTVISQRLRSERDCRLALKLVGLSGLLMAVFAVVQFATSNDRFFWFYRHPFTGTRDVLKGAFTNRNHFAQFLALSVGPLIWWLVAARRESEEKESRQIRRGLGPAQGNHSQFDNLIDVRQLLLLCAIAGVLLSVMISLSRGGMVASGLACFVCLAGLWKSGCVRSSLTAAVLGIAVVVAGGIAVFGGERLDDRVNQLASGDADKIDEMQARRTLWKADLKAIQNFPIVGTGVGSHREVYPLYMTELGDFSRWEFTHAESSWIHLTLETGFAGAGLVAVGILFVLFRVTSTLFSRHNHGHGEYLAAILASLVAGVFHAAFDFIWYVPAIVVTTIALAVAGLRLSSDFAQTKTVFMPRIGWMGLAAAAVVGLIFVQPELSQRVLGERYFNQYLTYTLELQRAAHDTESADQKQIDSLGADPESMEEETDTEVATESEHAAAPGTADYRKKQSEDAESIESMRSRMTLLMKSVRANPKQPRVQLSLALLSLKMFTHQQQNSDNPIDLAQIRDAALSAEFKDTKAMQEWLNRAFRKTIRLPMMANTMSRMSLKLCPIQGDAYLTLASTGFLRDPSDTHHAAYIQQAVLVRGFDPRVRFISGKEALAAGRQDEAIREWNIVFHANRDRRRKITQALAALAPSSFLIDEFHPSPQELVDVLQVHRAINRSNDLEMILGHIERYSEAEFTKTSNEMRVALLMEAYEAAYQMQQRERAENFLRKAVTVAEDSYWPRRALGLLLYEMEKYQEASEHFMWCYEQHPGDVKLEHLIKESRRLSIREQVPALRTSWRR